MEQMLLEKILEMCKSIDSEIKDVKNEINEIKSELILRRYQLSEMSDRIDDIKRRLNNE